MRVREAKEVGSREGEIFAFDRQVSPNPRTSGGSKRINGPGYTVIYESYHDRDIPSVVKRREEQRRSGVPGPFAEIKRSHQRKRAAE